MPAPVPVPPCSGAAAKILGSPIRTPLICPPMLNHVRQLIALRKANADLGNSSDFSVYRAEKGERLFAYNRGKLLCAVNPGKTPAKLPLDGKYRVVYSFGQVEIADAEAILQAHSFVILEPAV